MIKFLKNLVATAPVVVAKKKESLDQFRKIIYASPEEAYNAEENKFVEIATDVIVKTGTDKEESLVDYYLRNWRSVAPMWVRYYRKNLPSLGDNTSNRVERFFWTLKKGIQDTFVTMPDTIKAVIYLVQFCDRRLEEKYLKATNKCLVIHDKDANIRDMNKEASKVLNDRGCVIFHQAQKKLEMIKKDLKEDEAGGVCQQFTNGSKTYQATDTACNCTFFLNHQAPCVHILFLRSHRQEHNVFPQDLFHLRYHRVDSLIDVLEDQSEQLQRPEVNDDNCLDNEHDDISDPENDEPILVLSDRQKHAKIFPILMRLGNLISSHPTKKFLQYLDALNEVEKRVRRGQNFMMQLQNILAPVFDEEEDVGREGSDDENEREGIIDEDNESVRVEPEFESPEQAIGDDDRPIEDDVMDEENSEYQTRTNDGTPAFDDSQDTVKQSETSQDEDGLRDFDINSNVPDRKTKFRALKFKEGLKTKGRPKKRTKQFSFNKTAVDRVKRKKPAKKRRKGVKNVDFIDDNEDEDSEEEEDLDMKLDDDSNEDMEMEDSDVPSDSEIFFNLDKI